MEYLKNPFCKFKLHFDIDYNKKQNIISASLFKMITPYKNFSDYTDGLQLLIEYVENSLPDFKIRLFVDKSIMDDPKLKNMLLSNDSLQIVEFKCPDFLSENKYHHEGTFGTITRLFPMFDFKNNDADQIIVSDIDVNEYDIDNHKKIYGFINDSNIDYDLIYKGYSPYFTKYKYPMPQAGKLYNFKRFSTKYITDFINNIYDVEITHPAYSKPTVLKSSKQSKIKYGIDEYLMKHVVEELLKNEFNVAFIRVFTIGHPLYFSKSQIFKHPKSQEYFKYIFGKYYDSDNSLEDNFNLLDSLLVEPILSPKIEYISKNLFELLNSFIIKKDYSWILKDKLLNYDKNYKNIISSFEIVDNVKNKKWAKQTTLSNNKFKGGYYNKYIKYKTKYMHLKSSYIKSY